MLDAFATPRNRSRTLVLLLVCALSANAAGALGVSDNPPGILLALAAVIALVLAFVHPWRTSKRFRYLSYAAGLGFIVFAVLHNLFEALAASAASTTLLRGSLEALAVVAFLVAILLCPPCLLVGAVGAVVMAIRRRRQTVPAPPAAV